GGDGLRVRHGFRRRSNPSLDQDLERRNRLTATGLDLNAGATSASDGFISSTSIGVSDLGELAPTVTFWRCSGVGRERRERRIGRNPASAKGRKGRERRDSNPRP